MARRSSASEPEEPRDYFVLSALEHDRVDYPAGYTIALAASAAAPLLAVKAITAEPTAAEMAAFLGVVASEEVADTDD
jgi:hypothetical protein